jgi:4-amino-4-deoxy-L-arabinose transferase-like glycosyltransferase
VSEDVVRGSESASEASHTPPSPSAPSWLDRPSALVLSAGLAALLRGIHLYEIADTPFFTYLNTDSAIYHQWALEILGGDILTRSDPVFYLGPLYPYFVAACYALFEAQPFWVRLVQVLLSALSVGLVHHLGRRFFGAGPGLAAGLLAASYGPLIFYSSVLLPATLVIFLDLGCLAILASGVRAPRIWKWALAGGMLGLSATARGNVLLFAPIIPLALMAGLGISAWRKWLPASAWVAAGSVLAIAPVTLHNWSLGDDPVLLTWNAGPNFFIGNGPHADGIYQAPPRYRGEVLGVNVPQQLSMFRRIAETERGRALRPSEVSAFWMEQTWREIRERPGRWSALMLNKLYFAVSSFEVPNNRSIAFSRRFSQLLQLPLPGFGVVLPLALVGMALSRRRWREHGLLLGFCAAHLAALLAFFITARYRLVVVPVLIVYAGGALVFLARDLRARRFGAMAAPACAAVALFALIHWNAPEPRFTTRWVNLGNAHRDLGDFDEALASYDRALALQPEYAFALFKKAEVMRTVGRKPEARSLLDRAAAIARRDGDVALGRMIESERMRLAPRP